MSASIFSKATIALLLLVLVSNSCRKETTNNADPDPAVPAAMLGSRLYSNNTTTYAKTNTGIDTFFFNYADVNVTISRINPVTILFGADTLEMISSSADSIMFKKDVSYATYRTLTFYPPSDKIHYYYEQRQGNNGRSELVMNSK